MKYIHVYFGMLDRIHFEIIQGLKKYGSLIKTADMLHLTQSALSHSIKKLEAELGIRIWEKDGRQLRLTPAGEMLYKHAERILNQIQHVEDTMQELHDGRRGRVRIGVECHPCYQWLISRVGGFLHLYEDVDLDITRNFQFTGIEALLNHDIDIVLTPDKQVHENVVYYSVLDYELQLLVPSGHPLAGKSWLRPEDLVELQLFVYPIARERLDVFRNFFVPAGIFPSRVREVESTEIMLLLTKAGRGVCTFPDWLIREAGLQGLRLGEKGIHKNLWIAIRKSDADNTALLDLIEYISE